MPKAQHTKIGTHFGVGFKEMKVSQFIIKACTFNTHPKLHKWGAMFEMLNG